MPRALDRATAPQDRQMLSSICDRFSVTVMAPAGHAFLHRPQPMQETSQYLRAFLPKFFVGALDDDGVRAFVDMDEFARAFAHARAAGDALVFVHLRHTEIVDLDCVKFTYADAQPARDAAVFARCRCAGSRRCRPRARPYRESVF